MSYFYFLIYHIVLSVFYNNIYQFDLDYFVKLATKEK